MIFMDLNMPIMDGFETTNKIKELVQFNKIDNPIIIACTAYVDMKTKSKCFDLGMKSFISKPINRHNLKQTLEFFNMI